jgi:nucleoside-diphosphate-sugar epimerase
MNLLQPGKKIVVTGATGFLGSYFVRLLLKAGYLPILLVRPNKSFSALDRVTQLFTGDEIKRISVWEGDLTEHDSSQLSSKWINEGPIEAMFHIAGLVKFDNSLREMLYNVNVKGTKNALALARKLNISRFFYISTAYTAGAQELASETLHSLDSSFNNPYEESKCLAEHIVLKENNDKFKATILRPSIIIGDSNTGEADTQFSIYGFIRGLALFKRRVEKQLRWDKDGAFFPLQIQGDPNGFSNLVPVNYVAEVMLAALETECDHDIYHLTNPFAPTKQLLLEVFSELLQVKGMTLVKYFEKSSEWDEKFAQFISVYQPYMQDDPSFKTDHTHQLMVRAKKKMLHLKKEDYLRIFRPVLNQQDLPETVQV